MTDRPLRLGVAGLGRGFMLMLPTLRSDPRLDVVAGADPRAEARRRFAADFRGRAYDSVEALCRDTEVEALYIATPYQFHAQHALLGAAAGKHLLIEKPMALNLDECRSMNAAAQRAGIHLLVGHSHSFDAPILETRKLIEREAWGRLRMITALNFTDFLYRPRRPEELDTAQGGGVLFSQAAHQVDVVRLLGGGMLRSVRAATGNWDPERRTEGAYAAFLDFDDRTMATITYSGYAHFDSDEFCGWIGESGRRKNSEAYGEARRFLAQAGDPATEADLKNRRAYGAAPGDHPTAVDPEPPFHEHFGLVIASCERADLRPMPDGIIVYGDPARTVLPLEPPPIPRAEVIDELYAAVRHGRPPLHSGEWAAATLEVCLAIMRSSAEGREIRLAAQVPAGPSA